LPANAARSPALQARPQRNRRHGPRTDTEYDGELVPGGPPPVVIASSELGDEASCRAQRPSSVVALGATAGQALFGRSFPGDEAAGELLKWPPADARTRATRCRWTQRWRRFIRRPFFGRVAATI
jgi:hypothetical protein